MSCRSASSTVVPAKRQGPLRRFGAPGINQCWWEVLDLDKLTLRNDRRALDNVPKLPHVAGPGVTLEDLHDIRLDGDHRFSWRVLNSLRKAWTSSARSSRRSRSVGSVSAKTLSR